MSIYCLQPFVTTSTRILILGTMPSSKSISEGQYYANANNHFWDIIIRCLVPGWNPYKIVTEKSYPYRDRLLLLDKHGIGLWDILASCDRVGNADSKISNPILNKLSSFLSDKAHVREIWLTSTKTEAFYKKLLEKPPVVTRRLYSPSSLSPKNTFVVLNHWIQEMNRVTNK
jgi:TDG/mug DNA glycosylase family protein